MECLDPFISKNKRMRSGIISNVKLLKDISLIVYRYIHRHKTDSVIEEYHILWRPIYDEKLEFVELFHNGFGIHNVKLNYRLYTVKSNTYKYISHIKSFVVTKWGKLKLKNLDKDICKLPYRFSYSKGFDDISYEDYVRWNFE
jgi:hypothetical protein